MRKPSPSAPGAVSEGAIADAGEGPIDIGSYVLWTPISAGGMATVYLATKKSSAQLFAVKRMHPQFVADPEFCAMFLDEAKLASRIAHRNVVRTIEVVRERGELFLVMEYVEGESLSRLLKKFAPPPFDVIARVIVDTLIGLHAAHTSTSETGALLGVVHRDVSPHNILVGTDGGARVIDFGVAKAAGRQAHTAEGQVKGKLAYMSPEQILGAEVTPRSDVFSVGIVLWEFLTGLRLFGADNQGAVLHRLLHEPIRRPREVWAENAQHTLSLMGSRELHALDAVAMKALVRESSDRYVSAQAMAIDLERAIECAPAEDVAQWVLAAARKTLADRAAAMATIRARHASLDANTQSPPTLVEPALTFDAAESSDVHVSHAELPTRPLDEGPTRDLAADASMLDGAAFEESVVGRVLGGQLRIDERIGGGAGGAVYRARHLGLQKIVAVKVLHENARKDPRFCERFHAEALAASSLDHPNLVRVLDFGQERDGLLYFSMEFLNGTTLRELLTTYGRLPRERALRCMLQIATGLVHAHARGVIHRDVKPSNVVLVLGRDEDGNPVEVAKVCDFGIALQSGREGSEVSAGVAGTPTYMSPEQCRGGALDGRSDVYACGSFSTSCSRGVRRSTRGRRVRSRANISTNHRRASARFLWEFPRKSSESS